MRAKNRSADMHSCRLTDYLSRSWQLSGRRPEDSQTIPRSLALAAAITAAYSANPPFALSLSKCGRLWFDRLTRNGENNVAVFMPKST